MTAITGNGGKLEWVNDGFCDDMNNIEECIYDGGDCCGVNTNRRFCLNCECIGKSYKTWKIITCHIEKSCFWILDFTCSVDADCHQGYCEDKKCVCLDGHAYKEDCSFKGCEYDTGITLKVKCMS